MKTLFVAIILSHLAFVTQAAERTLSVPEFEALTTGKTLYFNRGGRPFGVEQYFNDKRVIWSFENGTCQFGIWYENAEGQICFVYDTEPGSTCWNFLELPDGRYAARAEGSPISNQLIVRQSDQVPIQCPLPDVGI